MLVTWLCLGSATFSDLVGTRVTVGEWQEVSKWVSVARALAFTHLIQLAQD